MTNQDIIFFALAETQLLPWEQFGDTLSFSSAEMPSARRLWPPAHFPGYCRCNATRLHSLPSSVVLIFIPHRTEAYDGLTIRCFWSSSFCRQLYVKFEVAYPGTRGCNRFSLFQLTCMQGFQANARNGVTSLFPGIVLTSVWTECMYSPLCRVPRLATVSATSSWGARAPLTFWPSSV